MSTATAGSSIASAPSPMSPVPPMPKGPAPAAPSPSVADRIASTYEKPAPLPPEQVRPPSSMPTKAHTPAPEAPKPPEPVKATEKPAEVPAAPKTLLPKKSAVKPAEQPKEGPADEFDRFQLPATASEEHQSQFTELKRVSRDQRAKLKELEARVNAPTTPTAEVERLRAEHKSATDRLAQLDLQSHPDFQRQFVHPKTKAIAEVSEILAYSGKEGFDVNGLLGKDRKNFSASVAELTKDLNPMDATTVQTALRDAYRIAGEEKAALANSSTLRDQIRQQTEAQARQAFAEVSDNLGAVGDFLVAVETSEGATAEEKAADALYNQNIAGLRQRVEKTVFGPTDEKKMSLLAWKAGVLDHLTEQGVPRMERAYQTLVQEHAAMAKELAALKGTRGSGPVAGDPSKNGGNKQSTEDMIAQTYRR